MNIETADRLIALRKRKGLSQEELAATLGISRQAVSKWERAESSPDMDNAIQLSRLYNVSLDDLFGNKPEYEIELDSMEPDLPEEPAEEAPEVAEAEDGAGFAGAFSASIADMVHDAVTAASEAAAEAKKLKDEAREGTGMRDIAIPADAETICDSSSYEGIRRLVCALRADLSITGTKSDVCTVRCEGPEKEKAHCFVYTVGDALHIESEDAKKKFFFGLQGRVRLKIFVELPQSLSVEAVLKGGDLKLDGVRSDLVNGKTGGGDIEVRGCVFDELILKTGGGDIGVEASEVQRTELITGGGEINADGLNASALMSARTGGGDVKLTGSAKCVEATTGGGDIELDVRAEGVEAKTGGGDIKIRCSGMKYVNAKTGGGDVKAALVGCTGVNADIASAGGEASIDYKNDRQASGRRLKFAAGDGSAVLEMRSGGGDIRVKVE